MLRILSALPLLALAAAQGMPAEPSGPNASNGTLKESDLEILDANFANAQLVPQLVQTFKPQGLLNVEYGGSQITTGQNLTADTVSAFPVLTVSPSDNATELNGNLEYTVLLADANPVGTDENSTAQTRHWLANGVKLVTTSTPWALNYNDSTSITDYAGPGPAAGSGSHRYVFLLYLQPSSFQAPSNLSTAGTPLGTWFVNEYAKSSGLGDIVAANYFQVENGTPTMTVAATSAVDTAAIVGQTGGSSASASGSASKSGGSGSGSGASSSSKPSGSATTKSQLGWGLIVGSLGVAGTVIGAILV